MEHFALEVKARTSTCHVRCALFFFFGFIVVRVSKNREEFNHCIHVIMHALGLADGWSRKKASKFMNTAPVLTPLQMKIFTL